MKFSQLKTLTEKNSVDDNVVVTDSKNSENEIETPQEEKELITSLIITNSITYIMGAYFAFCKLRNIELHTSEEFVTLLKTYDTQKDENNSVHNFISWYLQT
jgi:hypothetical protein